MATCLGKSCSFGLLRVPFVNCCQFMYLVVSLLVLRAGCDLIVLIPDHCLSFYFVLFSSGMDITAFDMCVPVNMDCAITSCLETDIENFSAMINHVQ